MSEGASKEPNKKRLASSAAAFLISVMLTLIASEIAIRLVLPHPAFYHGHPGNVPGLVTENEARGYSWSPGFSGEMTTADFSNTYTISEQGLRDVFFEASDKRTILAVGDSFTGGEGVEAEETWPKQLETLLRADSLTDADTRVVNAGVTGYSARQMRLMAEEYAPRFEADTIVVGVFAEGLDRLADPYTLYHQHLVRESMLDRLEPSDDGFIWYNSGFYNPRAAAVEIWTQKYFHFLAYLIKGFHSVRYASDSDDETPRAEPPIDEAGLSQLLGEVESLSEFALGSDRSLVVLIISRQAADGSFAGNTRLLADRIEAFCRDKQILVVNPLSQFVAASDGAANLRFPNDAHWTPLGHTLAAQELLEVTRQGSRLAESQAVGD